MTTATRTRPIVFSAPMVRAILEGRKTQTRRVVSPQPPPDAVWGENQAQQIDRFGRVVFPCYPHGQPGDRLWVRETWATTEQSGDHPNDAYVVYRATDPDWETMEGWRWRPPIFMARSASRITLELTGVRVERVQDITTADVTVEGVDNGNSNPAMGKRWENMQRMAFESLWDSLNAKRGHPWASNPWCWVLNFKVIKPQEASHAR